MYDSLDSSIRRTGQEERMTAREEFEKSSTINYYVPKIKPNKRQRYKDKMENIKLSLYASI